MNTTEDADFEALARYNAERARGIEHTDEHKIRMAAVQRRWEEHQKQTMRELGWIEREDGLWVSPPLTSHEMAALHGKLAWFYLGMAALIVGTGGFVLAFLPVGITDDPFATATAVLFALAFMVAIGGAIISYTRHRRS